MGSLPPAVPFHEIAEDGAGAAGWSHTARTALDARDRSIVRLAGRARAAREECPVARTGPRHRLMAPCHKWDCREACLEFTRAAQHYMEVTVRDQTALEAVTEHCVGTVPRMCIR